MEHFSGAAGLGSGQDLRKKALPVSVPGALGLLRAVLLDTGFTGSDGGGVDELTVRGHTTPHTGQKSTTLQATGPHPDTAAVCQRKRPLLQDILRWTSRHRGCSQGGR